MTVGVAVLMWKMRGYRTIILTALVAFAGYWALLAYHLGNLAAYAGF
jgi:hypothetical protein